jgi:hypothetical protein
MRYPAIILVVIMLGGCTTTPVILKHPTTGETAQCGPYVNTDAGVLWEAQCVGHYQAQGYQRIKN